MASPTLPTTSAETKPEKKSKPVLTASGRVFNAPLENPRWELFCNLFATSEDCFGHGVKAYAIPYDIDVTEKGQYFVAKSGASELLTKPYILERVNELLDIAMSDEIADKQLSFLILQNGDLGAKLQAIRERNRLKGRVVKKINLSGSVDTEASPEQLARIADVVRERLGK